MALCGGNLDSDEATSRPQQTHKPGNPTWPCDECGLWPPFLGGEENTQNDDPARMRLPDKARKDAAHAGQSSEAAASIATAVDAGKESHLHRGPERNKDTTFHCTCPFGDVAINSIVRSGQVDTASIAATNFGSKLDASRQKKKVSGARFCDGNVASNVMTGQLNHGNVWGNWFYVKSGKVSARRDNMRTNARSAERLFGQPRLGANSRACSTSHHRDARAHGTVGRKDSSIGR